MPFRQLCNLATQQGYSNMSDVQRKTSVQIMRQLVNKASGESDYQLSNHP